MVISVDCVLCGSGIPLTVTPPLNVLPSALAVVLVVRIVYRGLVQVRTNPASNRNYTSPIKNTVENNKRIAILIYRFFKEHDKKVTLYSPIFIEMRFQFEHLFPRFLPNLLEKCVQPASGVRRPGRGWLEITSSLLFLRISTFNKFSRRNL